MKLNCQVLRLDSSTLNVNCEDLQFGSMTVKFVRRDLQFGSARLAVACEGLEFESAKRNGKALRCATVFETSAHNDLEWVSALGMRLEAPWGFNKPPDQGTFGQRASPSDQRMKSL